MLLRDPAGTLPPAALCDTDPAGADVLAAVRAYLRGRWNGAGSPAAADFAPIPRPQWDSLTEALADAA